MDKAAVLAHICARRGCPIGIVDPETGLPFDFVVIDGELVRWRVRGVSPPLPLDLAAVSAEAAEAARAAFAAIEMKALIARVSVLEQGCASIRQLIMLFDSRLQVLEIATHLLAEDVRRLQETEKVPSDQRYVVVMKEGFSGGRR